MQTTQRLLLSFALSAGLTASLPAQETPTPPPEVVERTPEELDDLLGPIALYPDDLVALILPAATEPTDLVLAARFLDDGGAVADVDAQPWDEAVRALAHFPDVITWLNKNLSWTRRVGEAFEDQPADVMKSIQRLRGRAYAAGTLRDTPQQRIIVDGEVIRIVSAEEDVIYVPSYSTEVVYVERPAYYYTEPIFTFGIGWHIGSWHRWECDWWNHRLWVWNTHDYWRSRRHVHWSFYYHGRPRWDDDCGRSWRNPHLHRHAYRDRGYQDRNFNDHRRGPRYDRPSPYVENRRDRRDGDRDHNRSIPRGDLTGDRRNHERTAGSNNPTVGSNRNSRPDRNDGDRRSRDSRGSPPETRSNPSVPAVVDNTDSTPPPAAGTNASRNHRTNRPDRDGDARGNRSAPRATTPPPTTVTNNNNGNPTRPPPAVVRNETPRNTGRSDDNSRDYLQRSRNRPPAAEPARASPPSRSTYTAPAPRESRPTIARPSSGSDNSSSSERRSYTPPPPRYESGSSNRSNNNSGGGGNRSSAGSSSGSSRSRSSDGNDNGGSSRSNQQGGRNRG